MGSVSSAELPAEIFLPAEMFLLELSDGAGDPTDAVEHAYEDSPPRSPMSFLWK